VDNLFRAQANQLGQYKIRKNGEIIMEKQFLICNCTGSSSKSQKPKTQQANLGVICPLMGIFVLIFTLCGWFTLR